MFQAEEIASPIWRVEFAMEIRTEKRVSSPSQKCSLMRISGPSKITINSMQNLSFPQEWLWGCGWDSQRDRGTVAVGEVRAQGRTLPIYPIWA